MATDFTIKQHDQLPEFFVTLADALGDVVDLTGTLSIRFLMTNKATSLLTVNKPATVVDPVNGLVKYSWAAPDTDVAATYNAEFEVEFGDGRVETFPNSKYLVVLIKADLGGIGT